MCEMISFRSISCGLLGLLIVASAMAQFQLPKPTGKHGVGRYELDWTDSSRAETQPGTRDGNRELDRLYSEQSVQVYRPVAVQVELTDGRAVPALSYVLPEPPGPAEHNEEYAKKLRALAERLGFPADYVASIA
jgi:hypothetical protein